MAACGDRAAEPGLRGADTGARDVAGALRKAHRARRVEPYATDQHRPAVAAVDDPRRLLPRVALRPAGTGRCLRPPAVAANAHDVRRAGVGDSHRRPRPEQLDVPHRERTRGAMGHVRQMERPAQRAAVAAAEPPAASTPTSSTPLPRLQRHRGLHRRHLAGSARHGGGRDARSNRSASLVQATYMCDRAIVHVWPFPHNALDRRSGPPRSAHRCGAERQTRLRARRGRTPGVPRPRGGRSRPGEDRDLGRRGGPPHVRRTPREPLDLTVQRSCATSASWSPACCRPMARQEVLDQWRDGAFDLVVSALWLEELERVISRPKIPATWTRPRQASYTMQSSVRQSSSPTRRPSLDSRRIRATTTWSASPGQQTRTASCRGTTTCSASTRRDHQSSRRERFSTHCRRFRLTAPKRGDVNRSGVDRLDLARSPGLVEPRLEWAVQPKNDASSPCRARSAPSCFRCPAAASGPKYTSTERIWIDHDARLLAADARDAVVGLEHRARLIVVEHQRPEALGGDIRAAGAAGRSSLPSSGSLCASTNAAAYADRRRPAGWPSPA